MLFLFISLSARRKEKRRFGRRMFPRTNRRRSRRRPPPPTILSRARQVCGWYHSSQFAVLSCPVRFVAAVGRYRSCVREMV